MGIFAGLVALTFVVNSVYGYALAPSISWPEEYHFKAEEINLSADIMKPFEIWYSSIHNRSRIDMFGGTITRYYYGSYYDNEHDFHYGKIYMVHPQVAEDDSKTEVKCEVDMYFDDQEEFLPSLSEFEYSGEKEHDGRTVQVWTKNSVSRRVLKVEETLLVTAIDGEIVIPLHHYKKSFNTKDGSLQSDEVVNYYNYKDDVKLDDLDARRLHCEEWSELSHDLHEALKVLHPTIDSDVSSAFRRFKRHHDKNYEEEEHKMRQEIFRQNWRHIEEHNKKKLSYRLAINQFADKTMEELSYLSGMGVSDPIREGTHKFPHTDAEIEDMASHLPLNFDLRDLGVLSPVRNQASCGSCWAFAAAATLEGALARANGGRVLDLSEQSLVDCAWAFRSHGCAGTQAIDAVFDYLMKHGMPTVREYGPYLEEDGYCNINNMTEVYNIKGYVGVTKNSPNALRAAVYKYGPVTVGVLVTQNMVFYKSGVFYDLECEPGPMNHAVTLVGYGVRDGDLYWIIKNSWGEAWGESGYILLSASGDNCNTMHSAFYPVL
ncbi:pro-cathepsin H-like [Pectinophora gossypiella]|uniref:pro-cathepsin H-like n=1 Tax=Pectinophora gossypiella TaxID=13191 RepID=UPI00214E7046|nr:pro-cathepsin H-like [Pectinophora gossypiella]